jgi:hypothetical protein
MIQQAMLVIKTVNGYIVAPYVGALPMIAPEMRVAQRLDDSYRADSVQEALREHFEPKVEA